MTDLNVPNDFVSGTSIVAADMNANFSAVETFLNSTGVPVVQSRAVTPAALGIPGFGYCNYSSTALTTTPSIISSGSAGVSPNSSYVSVDAASGKLTGVVAGAYLMWLSWTTSSASGGPSQMTVSAFKNGSTGTTWASNSVQINGTTNLSGQISRPIVMAAGDTVQAGGLVAASGSGAATIFGTIYLLYLGPTS